MEWWGEGRRRLYSCLKAKRGTMDIKVAIIENISDIDELCEYIDEHGSSNDSLNDRLEQAFEKIDLPCTAVCEYDYVDRIYRDTYYNYFSGKYYPFDRNCKRLSFFFKDITR